MTPDPVTGDAPREAALLRQYLAQRDVPCPGCGYNLRGLTADHCPECNQELVLRVGLVEPKMRLWLASVLGLAFGVGFNALLLVYVAIITTVQVRSLGAMQYRFLTQNTAGMVVEGALLALALWRGARVRRWPVFARWVVCVVAWLLTVANVVAFSMTIR